jgi:uncharacterized protein YndB with AHSA1/START domain
MGIDLSLERVIDGTPEEVFDAFVDPAAQKEWYQDHPDWVVEAECDLKVGGHWDVSFGPAGKKPYKELSVFTEVDRPKKLAYVSTFVVPNGPRWDTELVITFDRQGNKTLLTIVQTGFPTEKDRDDHQRGWPNFIDRLEKVVAARRD